MEEKQYGKARESFDRAIAARSDSPHTFYFRARSLLAQNHFSEAIPDLERVVEGDRKFDYYRAAGLLADAYARTGDMDRSALLFGEVTQYSTTPETLYNYANYLKLQNRRDEAREWVQKLLAKKRTLPRYMGRIERPWFRKGKALLKELATT
jgi:tetratricopeptide (TPR) repeat protein